MRDRDRYVDRTRAERKRELSETWVLGDVRQQLVLKGLQDAGRTRTGLLSDKKRFDVWQHLTHPDVIMDIHFFLLYFFFFHSTKNPDRIRIHSVSKSRLLFHGIHHELVIN